jgi:ATP-binding cassette subfamily G (WHITE) protein 2 (SNQ2)
VVDFFNLPKNIWEWSGMANRGREVDILKNFRGVAKPGEMVLVLGRPGSGCTTFLKVLANQRKGYTKVDGEVMYGRFSADTFAKRYRGESVYNEEGRIWISVLLGTRLMVYR